MAIRLWSDVISVRVKLRDHRLVAERRKHQPSCLQRHLAVRENRMRLGPHLQAHGKVPGPSKERLPPERPVDSGSTY